MFILLSQHTDKSELYVDKCFPQIIASCQETTLYFWISPNTKSNGDYGFNLGAVDMRHVKHSLGDGPLVVSQTTALQHQISP